MNFTILLAILRARIKFMLLVLGITIATAVVISLLLPPTYKATTTVVVDAKNKDPVSGAVVPAQLMSSYVATQVDIITSQNVAGKVVDTLRLTEEPKFKEDFKAATDGIGSIREWIAEQLINKLEVEPSRESSAINIRFKARNPESAATIANAFARAYIDTNLELRTGPAQRVSAWYESQIRQLRDNYEKAQARLSDYQRTHGLVAADERLDVETARLADLSSALVASQSLTYDTGAKQGQSGDAADVMNSAVVQQLRTELARRESELAQLEQNLGHNHPQRQSAEAHVNALRAKLAAEVKTATKVVSTTATAARQREAGLRGAVGQQKARVLESKKQRDDMSVLISDVQSATLIYDGALQRYGQARLESQTNQADIAVLNEATPPIKPDSPKLLLNLALAVFLGGSLAIGVALVLEMLDRRVRTPQDVTDLLGIPVLAVFAHASGLPKFLRRRVPK